MMKTTLILAILTTLSSIANCEKKNIRGVSPSNEHLYQPEINEAGEQIWRCLSDPTIILSYDKINDDYCDCPDGSDEPGTNACPFNPDRKFYCHNDGYIPQYIENYKLNDGVCDYDICCDGSDEYVSGKCTNKCKEISDQFEQYKKNALQNIKSALDNKAKLIKDASEEKEMVKMSVDALKNKIRDLELSESYQEETKQENLPLSKIEPHLDVISQLIKSQQDENAFKDKKIAHLESILSKLMNGYNPNFNDLVVKESVNSFQEYLSNSGEQTAKPKTNNELKKLRDSIIENIPNKENKYPTIGEFIHQKYLDLITRITSGPQIMEQPVVTSPIEPSKNKELKKKLKQELVIYEGDLDRNYGPNDILRAVKSTSIGSKIDGYNYILEFFGSIYQDNVLVGQFEKVENNDLYYSNGAKCWNGPKRSAVVHMICGAENKILSLSEPEKCEYSFDITSPIACDENSELEILSKFKINYDLL